MHTFVSAKWSIWRNIFELVLFYSVTWNDLQLSIMIFFQCHLIQSCWSWQIIAALIIISFTCHKKTLINDDLMYLVVSSIKKVGLYVSMVSRWHFDNFEMFQTLVFCLRQKSFVTNKFKHITNILFLSHTFCFSHPTLQTSQLCQWPTVNVMYIQKLYMTLFLQLYELMSLLLYLSIVTLSYRHHKTTNCRHFKTNV